MSVPGGGPARWHVGAQSAKALARRAVQVRIYPGVRDIAESRAVLRTLKNYGDITFYESKRWDPVASDPHTAIGIYQHPDSASKLLSAAPFHFRYKAPLAIGLVGHPMTRGLMQMSLAERRNKHSDEDAGKRHHESQDVEDQQEQDFYLTAEPSQEDHLARFQERVHYWGYTPQNVTFPQDALRWRTPTKAMSEIPSTEIPTLPRRLVNRKLETVARRKSLRELQEGDVSLDGAGFFWNEDWTTSSGSVKRTKDYGRPSADHTREALRQRFQDLSRSEPD